jgi:uncharacterized membrane protein
MAQHKHKNSNSHKHTHREAGESNGKKLHKDWRVWLAVAMMLAAMITYVLTLDDSVIPSLMRQ